MIRVFGLAICAALVTLPAFANFAGVPLQPCDNQPPPSAQRPVMVPVDIFTVPGGAMFATCNKQVSSLVIYGCTFQASAGHPAIILLNADENSVERACTLRYEEAHLPPNNWLDHVMEARTLDVPAQPIPASLIIGH
jgi:hypothetical protein